MLRYLVWVVASLALAAVSFFVTLQVLPERPIPRRIATAATLGPAILPTVFRFAAGTPSAELLRSGWSGLEPWGVWSDGPIATLKLPTPKPAQAIEIAIQLRPFLPPGVTTLAVDISVNDVVTVHAELAGLAPVSEIVISVQADVIRGGDIELTFRIPKPHRPVDFGMGGDTRRLGIGLESVEVRAARGS